MVHIIKIVIFSRIELGVPILVQWVKNPTVAAWVTVKAQVQSQSDAVG